MIPAFFWFGIALLVTLVILAACNTTPPGTGAACDALRPDLPTYSSDDTEQSKREGATFLDVFNATCGGHRAPRISQNFGWRSIEVRDT